MKIHPRIQTIIDGLKDIPFEEALTVKTLRVLHGMEASYAEAIVALHQYYNIDADYVAEYIRANNVFPVQDLTDYAYEIMLYLDDEA